MGKKIPINSDMHHLLALYFLKTYQLDKALNNIDLVIKESKTEGNSRYCTTYYYWIRTIIMLAKGDIEDIKTEVKETSGNNPARYTELKVDNIKNQRKNITLYDQIAKAYDPEFEKYYNEWIRVIRNEEQKRTKGKTEGADPDSKLDQRDIEYQYYLK